MMDRQEEAARGLRESPRGGPAATRASLRESVRLCERWHGAADGRLRYAFAPRFVLSCTEGLLRDVVAEARHRGARLHTHSSENQDEVALVRTETGRSNVRYLHDLGFTGPDVGLAHCVWLDDDERSILADTGTHVLHCPSSNLKLGSGIAPIPELQARGVSVSLGADGAPCNNNLDAFQEMRLAALIQKPRMGARAMPASQVFDLATCGGARALGLEDEIGSLEVGKQADFALVDLDRTHSGPGGEPISRLVYAARSTDVTDVFVSGRALLRRGVLQVFDEREARDRAHVELSRLLKRARLPS